MRFDRAYARPAGIDSACAPRVLALARWRAAAGDRVAAVCRVRALAKIECARTEWMESRRRDARGRQPRLVPGRATKRCVKSESTANASRIALLVADPVCQRDRLGDDAIRRHEGSRSLTFRNALKTSTTGAWCSSFDDTKTKRNPVSTKVTRAVGRTRTCRGVRPCLQGVVDKSDQDLCCDRVSRIAVGQRVRRNEHVDLRPFLELHWLFRLEDAVLVDGFDRSRFMSARKNFYRFRQHPTPADKTRHDRPHTATTSVFMDEFGASSNKVSASIRVDTDHGQPYSACIGTVLSEYLLRFAVTACGARFDRRRMVLGRTDNEQSWRPLR